MLKKLALCFLLMFQIAAVAEDKISIKRAQLDELRKEIDSLSAERNKDQQNQHIILDQLKRSDIAIAAQSKKLAQNETRLAELLVHLQKLKTEQAITKRDIKNHAFLLKEQMQLSYVLGQHDAMKLLLQPHDPQKLGRMMTYFDYLNKARAEKMADILQKLALLNNQTTELQQETAKQEKLKNSQTEQYAKLKASKQQRQELSAALKTAISNKDQQLNALYNDEIALKTLLSSLLEKNSTRVTGESLAIYKGKLAWPVNGKLLHRFGEERVGDSLLWQGIFIKAKDGSPVKPVAPGKVVYADWLRGFGLLVIVEHGNGYMSLYAYNQNIHKKIGDKVSEHDIIAEAGQSGSASLDGLYFEIRHNGKPIDPLAWLNKS